MHGTSAVSIILVTIYMFMAEMGFHLVHMPFLDAAAKYSREVLCDTLLVSSPTAPTGLAAGTSSIRKDSWISKRRLIRNAGWRPVTPLSGMGVT